MVLLWVLLIGISDKLSNKFYSFYSAKGYFSNIESYVNKLLKTRTKC